MKIFCISDLHLEFYRNDAALFDKIKGFLPEADVCILAGDIGYPLKHYSTHLLKLLKKFKEIYSIVVYVPGNHEYFLTSNFNLKTSADALEVVCRDAGVYLLNNNTLIIEGVLFLGTTLWSHIDQYTFDEMYAHHKIFKSVDDYNKTFLENVEWLKSTLQSHSHFDSIVVISHHLPSTELCPPRFQNSIYMSGYYSDVFTEELFDFKNIKYWFAGHSHESVVKKIKDTTFIVNPLGYPNEKKETEVSYKSVLLK
jgi:UDP-2,3-diacylglucosamine pyrophosphatase LpxH